MKQILCLAAALLALNFTPGFGQTSDEAKLKILAAQAEATAKQSLTKFNLDFPGGTPAELVKAIEKATAEPLNVIIPTEGADIQLPPLKMNDVNVAQLFLALEVASGTITRYNGPLSRTEGKYGFESAGAPSNNSIWHFYVNPDLPQPPQKICQFYSLSPYLDRGFTVDDITTAIQAGWKMAGVTPTPELNYHKETKLLIAYGQPSPLEMIRQVLQNLPASTMTRNEIDSMKSQIKDLQDQVGALKKGILDISRPNEGRRPPPSQEKSGN